MSNQPNVQLFKSRHAGLMAFVLGLRLTVEAEQARKSANPIKLLSDKERTRLGKVRADLEAGTFSYGKQKDKETPDQGGLDLDRAKLAGEALAQIEVDSWDARSKRWNDGRKATHQDVTLAIDLKPGFVESFPMITSSDGKLIPDPDRIRCSFCQTVLLKHEATVGTSKLEKNRKNFQVAPAGPSMRLTTKTGKWDTVQVSEDVRHYTRRVYACPDHALLVQGTIFPSVK